MIQSSKLPIVVLIDYVIIKGVYEKINLNILDVSKANIRLVHVSVYLS